ncbi:MAG: hypothetical protein ACLUFV_06250 [Acutalibacteraceae bacterium]
MPWPPRIKRARRLYLTLSSAECKPGCCAVRRARSDGTADRHGEAGEPLGLAVMMLHESLVLLGLLCRRPAARGGEPAAKR